MLELVKSNPETLINGNNDDILETYDALGKRLGCLIRGGEVDYKRVSTAVVNDMKNELIKGITFDRL